MLFVVGIVFMGFGIFVVLFWIFVRWFFCFLSKVRVGVWYGVGGGCLIFDGAF